MPRVVWQPAQNNSHVIPVEFNVLPLGSIVLCDCGRLIVRDKDDYGQDRWRHLTRWEIFMMKLFAPERIGQPRKGE